MAESPILATKYSFNISIDGITDENEYFYAVEGLSIQYDVQPFSAGGDLNTVFMANKIESQPLILKRPVINIKSGLVNWCSECLETGKFTPKDMNIFIMSPSGNINNQWLIEKATPIGFKISPIDLHDDQTVLMEIITLVYYSLKRIK